MKKKTPKFTYWKSSDGYLFQRRGLNGLARLWVMRRGGKPVWGCLGFSRRASDLRAMGAVRVTKVVAKRAGVPV